MHIVSVINYKGGVGKTSVTANVAAELAFRGFKVLMIDLDAQASLTFSFMKPDVWNESFAPSRTIKTWFDSFQDGNPIKLSSLIYTPPKIEGRVSKRNGSLHLIPSHLGLINVDLELATELSGATLQQAKRNFLKVHRRLIDGIDDSIRSEYDVLMIDCPPNFNIVTKTAIIASDHLLIPARPDYLSTLGIDYLIRSTNQLVSDYNDFASLDPDANQKISPRILGVVFTMIQEYRGKPMAAQRPHIRSVQQMDDLNVLQHYVKRNDSVFADAPQYGVPVVLNRYGNQSHESVVRGLEEVTTDFSKLLKLPRYKE